MRRMPLWALIILSVVTVFMLYAAFLADIPDKPSWLPGLAMGSLFWSVLGAGVGRFIPARARRK